MPFVSSSSGCAGPRIRRTIATCGAIVVAIFSMGQRGLASSALPGNATDIFAAPPLWAFFVAGIIVLGAVVLIACVFVRSARRQTLKARELAIHLETERDLAQRALVQKLEQERELSKEKMQFESQLTEYEKYASHAQLALGAAHEINNPLLGILSHLELDWKDADGERRAEIEQCIEGARRISSAVRGLLDYARQGPLTLSEVDLRQLVSDALRFVAHQPLFRRIQLQNCV